MSERPFATVTILFFAFLGWGVVICYAPPVFVAHHWPVSIWQYAWIIGGIVAAVRFFNAPDA